MFITGIWMLNNHFSPILIQNIFLQESWTTFSTSKLGLMHIVSQNGPLVMLSGKQRITLSLLEVGTLCFQRYKWILWHSSHRLQYRTPNGVKTYISVSTLSTQIFSPRGATYMHEKSKNEFLSHIGTIALKRLRSILTFSMALSSVLILKYTIFRFLCARIGVEL